MPRFPSLLAFGWLSLPMLGWLAVAAAPLLIHLWSRRQYRPMPWAAMQFLLAANRRRQTQRRVEQWLLLAVRTALVALVVVAFAGPYTEAARPGAGGGATHRVLVLDGSFSMGCREAGTARFDRAKQIARQIINESPQGDRFSLALMAQGPRVIIGKAAVEPAAVVREIDNLELTQGGADLPAAVSAVRRLVEDVAGHHPPFKAHEVCFLTDLQRATWRRRWTAARWPTFCSNRKNWPRRPRSG